MQILQIVFSNVLYMAGMATLVAIIILILRKAFDKKISPKWKFAMWGLLLISLIIPFRMTLYAKNENFYTISTIVDLLDKVRNILAIHKLGKLVTIIWLIGMLMLLLFYTINSLRLKKKIGKEEIRRRTNFKTIRRSKRRNWSQKKNKINQTKRKNDTMYLWNDSS